MSLHYTRARVDRASLETTGPIRFVAASEGRQADGIDLRMAGAQLDRYRGNPVVLYGHRYWSRDDLPIGRAVGVTVEGERLLIDVEFDQADLFAVEVERKLRAGYMNAVSIGFTVTEWENENDNYWRGGVATGWELHELSVVPVPMDATAVVESGRGLTAEDITAAVRAALTPPPTTAPNPDLEGPARADLDPSAVRNLLAAFTPEEGNNE